MDHERGYQHGYADINPGMYDRETRARKARTMLAVLAEELGADALARADVLNLGCSAGLIDEALAPHVRTVTGVDIDEQAVAAAKARCSLPNLRFEVGDAMGLALPDASFDVVICSQVYEHVPDAGRMMAEILRVMRPGGVCYFAATSRWSVIEMHYKLPFLSWLPPGLADRYLRLAGRGDRYYERHLGVRDLRRIAAAFRISDATPRILADPDRYGARYLFPTAMALWGARFLLRMAYPLFPGFVWLLRKPGLEADAADGVVRLSDTPR